MSLENKRRVINIVIIKAIIKELETLLSEHGLESKRMAERRFQYEEDVSS